MRRFCDPYLYNYLKDFEKFKLLLVSKFKTSFCHLKEHEVMETVFFGWYVIYMRFLVEVSENFFCKFKPIQSKIMDPHVY